MHYARAALKAKDDVAAEHKGALIAPRIESVSSIERPIVANFGAKLERLDRQVDLRPVDVSA